MSSRTKTNFAVLQQDPQLLHLGMLAEKYFTDDPNTCLLKLRQLAGRQRKVSNQRKPISMKPLTLRSI